jgi:hypothetical protein
LTTDNPDPKGQLTLQGLYAFGERLKGRAASLVDGDIAAFIGRFRAFRNGGIAELRYDAFVTHFSEMTRTMRKTRISAREVDRKTASTYNVFEILGLQEYEVTTHSAFLANLLSANGSHAQGDLFFRTFVETLVPPPRRGLYEGIGFDDYEVTQERSVSRGSIDIFVESTKRERRFAIIIENKVFAADGPSQLANYYDCATAELGYSDEQLLIVYLTLGGWAPTEQSLASYSREDWIKKGLLVEISYWEGVKTWLEKALREVKAKAVATVLRQYIATIQHLGKE